MIEEEIDKLIEEIATIEDDNTKVALFNYLTKKMNSLHPFRQQPISKVIWVHMNDVISNEYNPNVVAPPEMKLLIESITEDGITQPIVCYYDNEKKKYIIVDGFHRSQSIRTNKYLNKQLKSYLPIVVIEKDIGNRMASTVRHNRARGVHTIHDMRDLIKSLYLESEWTDEQVMKHLGLDSAELLRFKQFTGLPELFKDVDFSKSWY